MCLSKELSTGKRHNIDLKLEKVTLRIDTFSKPHSNAGGKRLSKDLKDIEERDETILIIGDLNRAVGCDEWGVAGNHSRVSYGGQLIRER